MRKGFACLLIVLLAAAGGCSHAFEPEDTSSVSQEESSSEAPYSEAFTPYQIELGRGLPIYQGPGYGYSVIGSISERGTYGVVGEFLENGEYGTVLWGKLDTGEGWINLDEVEAYEVGSYILPFSSSRALTQEDVAGLSREELVLARNEIYARHGRIFQDPELRAYFESQVWYSGTIEPEDFSQDLFTETERENIEFILEYEASLDGAEDGPSSQIGEEEESSAPPSSDPGDGRVPSTGGAQSKPAESSPAAQMPEAVSHTVKGVTFTYIGSYSYEAEYVDAVIDYDISMDIEYCEPGDYMSESDRIIGIHNSGGLYEKEEIGSLYRSAGTDDFAVFKITVKGKYEDEFSGGYKNIEYRKYNSGGALLKDAASGITDHELMLISENSAPVKGSIQETFYMGFYRSEVARVDFKILNVGPGGLGEW